MSEPRLEPPAPELARWLDRAKSGEPEIPLAAEERLRARLGDALLASAVVPSILEAALRSAPAPHAANAGHGWAAALAGKVPALKLAAVFAAGAATGVLGHTAVSRPPEPRVVYVDRPAPVVVVPSAAPPPPEPTASVVVPSPVARPQAATKDAELAAERMQIEGARAALARGDAAGTLATIDRYKARFPHGQLREEAEVVAIQALVRAGRGSDARARAALYRARYPDGFFRAAVEDAIRNIP